MAIKYPDEQYNNYPPSPAPTAPPAPAPTSSDGSDAKAAEVAKPSGSSSPSLFLDPNTKKTTSTSTVTVEKVSKSAPAEPKESEAAPKTAKEMTLADRYMARFPDASVEDIINILEQKYNAGSISDDELAVLNELKDAVTSKNDSNSATSIEPEKSEVSDDNSNNVKNEKVRTEYNELYEKPGTEYEKTSRVIDKYLMENDSVYQSLSVKERKIYRDSKIADMREKLGYSKNITQAQRNIMQKEIAKLYIDAAVNEIPLNSETTADDVNSRLKEINKKSSPNILGDITFDESKTATEQLNSAIEQMLVSDPKFKNITDPNKKQNYIEQVKVKLSKQLIPININDEDLKSKLLVSGIKTLQEKGFKNLSDIEKLVANSDMQFDFIETFMNNNKDLISKIKDKSERTKLEASLERANIYREIKNKHPEKNVLEADILVYLKKLEKIGKLNNDALKELYNSYSNLEKLDKELKAKNPKSRGILDEESNLASLATFSFMSGLSPDKFIEKKLTSDGKLLTGDDLIKNLKEMRKYIGDQDTAGIEVLRTFLGKHYKPEEVRKLMHDAGYNTRKSLIYATANNYHSLVADFYNGVSENGSNDQINDYKNIANCAAVAINSEGMHNIQVKLTDSAYKDFANNLNSGVHKYYTQADQDLFRNLMIADSNLTSERKTVFTKSYIITGTAEQQLHDAQYFSTVKDAAVTEGLAAAEKFVDKSIKSQFKSLIDNAIDNNGYSQSEINNINAARETGKTSYERSVESGSTNTTQSKTETKTVSQSNSTAKNSSAPQSSSNSSSIKLSNSNTNSAQQMRQTLAQLQYDSAVAQKEKAMQDLLNIIDKIQNDQEVRAQKQAELKAKEASSDAEIAEAIKAADAKSAEKQNEDETKISQEAKESVGVLNEIVETKKVEEVAKKFNISVEDVKVLREAHRQGDLNTIYTKLGSISADAQKKFVQFLARKDTATIIGFIRNRSTDKSLIKELCRLNPNLIKSLDPDLLLDCGIAKADIIKYAGASQLASMLESQARLGHTDVLNQFYEALGYSDDQIAYAKRTIPGSPEWESQMRDNMKNASGTSISSTRVRSGNFPEGQTRQKIRPQDYPDYKEYLA